MWRTGLVVSVFSVLVGCVQTGEVRPLRTEQGRDQAKQAFVDLGKGYLQEGLTGQAKAPLQSALKIDPGDTEAHEVLALVFQQEMEPELAEKHFKRALSKKREARTLNNYGSFLFEQGEYEKAFEVFTEASKDTMYASRSRVFENLGLTALRLEQAEQAAHYFERALRLNSQQPRSLLELASLTFDQRDYVSAQYYYRAFTSLSDHNARSLLIGARLAYVFEDRDQAASLGLQLKRLYPASAEYKAYQMEQR